MNFRRRRCLTLTVAPPIPAIVSWPTDCQIRTCTSFNPGSAALIFLLTSSSSAQQLTLGVVGGTSITCGFKDATYTSPGGIAENGPKAGPLPFSLGNSRFSQNTNSRRRTLGGSSRTRPSIRLDGNFNCPMPSHYGVTAGAGLVWQTEISPADAMASKLATGTLRNQCDPMVAVSS